MTRREQQRAYEEATYKRDTCLSYARLLATQRWDAIRPGALRKLERDIKYNVRLAREANQEARRIWNER